MDKENAYLKLQDEFLDDIFLLLEDFIAIDKTNSQTLRKKRKQFLKHASDDEFGIMSEIMDDFSDKSRSSKHFQRAMFTYLFALYEKHINELIIHAIRNEKSVKEKYDNFYEKYAQATGKSFWREIASLSKKKQTEFVLANYKDVKEKSGLPDLYWQQALFDISDGILFKNKRLKFTFTEIRARRNLIIHRKNSFDNEYVEKMKQIIKSKKVEDPKETIQYYYKREIKDISNLDDLLIKDHGVYCGFHYISRTVKVFIDLYLMIIDKVSNSTNMVNNVSVHLNYLYFKTTLLSFAFDSLGFLSKKLRHKPDEIEKNYKKGNYLLSTNIILKVLKKEKTVSENIKKVLLKLEKDKIELENFFRSKEDPIYRILLAVSEDRQKDCLKILKEFPIKDLTPQMRKWPLFYELFTDKAFKKVFDKRLNDLSKMKS